MISPQTNHRQTVINLGGGGGGENESYFKNATKFEERVGPGGMGFKGKLDKFPTKESRGQVLSQGTGGRDQNRIP